MNPVLVGLWIGAALVFLWMAKPFKIDAVVHSKDNFKYFLNSDYQYKLTLTDGRVFYCERGVYYVVEERKRYILYFNWAFPFTHKVTRVRRID